MTPKVQLIAYADRFGGDLQAVHRLLTAPPLDVIDGVHLLPFFVPFDGADAGFDPIDHAAVDPRLGSWADIRALADAGIAVTADLIVNHVSAQSREFDDWLARGAASEWDGMFLTFDTVFPRGAGEQDITRIYRPRAGLPFTPYQLADGSRRLVWTTFRPSQIDLDVNHPKAEQYLHRILATLAEAGVQIVRLDAIGYAIKTAGTDSFMTPQTLAFVERLTAAARTHGLQVLVEVHAHYTQQQAIAAVVDFVYDFALPPLLLHALSTGELDQLLHWLTIRPNNAITVLDTHDGIGIVDAGPAGGRPGLLDAEQQAAIFERAARATGGESTRASHAVAWTALPHQINSTFFSVLGGDVTAFVLARAVQLFVPGPAQLYYVGLLGGRNDMALFEHTGEGRDVNRHHYSDAELQTALDTDVARAQLALAALRSRHSAFDGQFAFERVGASQLELSWTNGTHRVALLADFTPGRPSFRIDTTDAGGVSSEFIAAVPERDAG